MLIPYRTTVRGNVFPLLPTTHLSSEVLGMHSQKLWLLRLFSQEFKAACPQGLD